MPIKLTPVEGKDLFIYHCPDCDKGVYVSGDDIDWAKLEKKPMELKCGHSVPFEELP